MPIVFVRKHSDGNGFYSVTTPQGNTFEFELREDEIESSSEELKKGIVPLPEKSIEERFAELQAENELLKQKLSLSEGTN